MARAKRTARADARRRHRAEQGLPLEGAMEGDASETTGQTQASVQSRPARLGIGTAFRQSFRPLNMREDLAALPHIATRTKALWLPVALTIVAAVAVGATRGADVVSLFAFQYFIVTPAIGGVFIAGFLAPRASWALGVIVGLVSAVCYSILGTAGLLPAGFAEAFTAQASAAITSSLVFSSIMGAFFASAAAWYRRFLQLSNPNRGRGRPQQPVRRGTDGRSRTAGDQKAGARR